MVQTLFRSDLRSLSIHLIKLYKLAGYASQTHNNTKYYTHKTTFTIVNPVNPTSDDYSLRFFPKPIRPIQGWSHLCTDYHLCTTSHLCTDLYIDDKQYIDEIFLYIDEK